MNDDLQLLNAYAATGDQAAFYQLVNKHLPMVYNLARREFSGNPAHSEDIAQSVFILLAQKSREQKISRRQPLAAWLYQTTRYCCANLKRIEARRTRRESEVAMLIPTITHTPAPTFDEIELLNTALADLPPTDRDLLLLRYSPAEPPIPQIAATLNISPAAAEKRIARALEKLRAHFSRKEQLASAASLPALLALQSVATPVHLSALVTNAATSATTASPLALALVASFAKSSLPLKAAAILLLTLSSVSAMIGWNLLGTSSIAAATNTTTTTLPDADALPDYITGPLPQRTYFAYFNRNVFPQGAFDNSKENQMPTGFSAAPDPFASGAAAFDATRKIIRLTSTDFGKKIELRSSIPLKPEWRRLALRATLANKNIQLGDSQNAAAGVFFYPVDKNNSQLAPGLLISFNPTQGTWYKVRMGTLTLPPNAANLDILIRLSDAKGQLCLQNLGITPVDEKTDPNPSQVVELQTAIKNNDVQTVTNLITADKRLLEARNMNWDCGTPLIGAAWTGHVEVLQALLQLGADIHATDDNGDTLGGHWTACTTAAYQGRPACFKLLFDAAPEKPDYLLPIIHDGMRLHTNGPDNYQQCLDYITQKFPSSNPAP